VKGVKITLVFCEVNELILPELKNNYEAEKIIELIAKLNSEVLIDDSLSYLSDEQYDRILEGVKKLTINIYNHKLVSPTSHDRLDELTDVMTSLASLDFSKRATVEGTENHLDYIAIGLNLLCYQLAKQVEPMKVLKTFFESVKEPIIVTDSKDNVLLINNTVQNIIGTDNRELYLRPVDDILKKDSETIMSTYSRIKAAIKGPNEQLTSTVFSYYELRNDDGFVMGHIYYGLSEANEELNSSVKEIEKIEENNPLDFNRVHHDITGPIKSLKGAVTVGKINANDKGTLRLFEIIDKCRQAIEAHFTDLFDMIFLKSNTLVYEDIALYEMINTITSSFSLNQDYRSVTFNISIPSHAVLHSNKKLVNSIFQNLISNALKYSKTNSDQQSYVGIRIQNSDNSGCIIEISDNGIGISPENVELIFKPHFRASFQAEGKGLGLYIVSQAVQKLNGKISVKSEYGQGTTFILQLPNNKE
jgi:PAS domain S-box-containing protein